ncbi:hypothetical protein L2744_01495 [Shewanella profunda]|uniref:hypothetical protein n=1 Tax=Shewanella profunda TaxID=254793 RepID=UPI00200E8807|nr:hypothetical protein [Shewanella profunda]MCL1088307.1 hypothetical protein [Shewanella profunda]
MLVCVAIMLIAHSASYTPKTYVQRSEATHQHVQMHNLDASTPDVKQNAVPHSPPDVDSTAESKAQAVESCNSLNSNDTNLVRSDSASQPMPCPSSDYVSHSDDLDFAPINSPRFISLAQHDVREVKPVYLLAMDFTAEPTPNVVESTVLDINSDWTLSAVSSPARISGWKVSNLQYRFSQQAA